MYRKSPELNEMDAKTLVHDAEMTTQTQTGVARTLPMEHALKAILSDSQDAPQAYLDESQVPHGGE